MPGTICLPQCCAARSTGCVGVVDRRSTSANGWSPATRSAADRTGERSPPAARPASSADTQPLGEIGSPGSRSKARDHRRADGLGSPGRSPARCSRGRAPRQNGCSTRLPEKAARAAGARRSPRAVASRPTAVEATSAATVVERVAPGGQQLEAHAARVADRCGAGSAPRRRQRGHEGRVHRPRCRLWSRRRPDGRCAAHRPSSENVIGRRRPATGPRRPARPSARRSETAGRRRCAADRRHRPGDSMAAVPSPPASTTYWVWGPMKETSVTVAVQHRVAEAGGRANRLGTHDRHRLVAHREPVRRPAPRAYRARPYRRGSEPSPSTSTIACREAVGGPHEVRDKQRLRPAVGLDRVADLLDLARVHDRDPIRHRKRLLLIVGDVHERDPDLALDLLEHHLHLLSELQIECAERLVEQQHRRLAARVSGPGRPAAAGRRTVAWGGACSRPVSPTSSSISATRVRDLPRLTRRSRSPKATFSNTFRCGNSA